MIGGCIKNAFAMVGCTAMVLIGGIVAFQYRDQISETVRSFREETDRGGGSAAADARSVGRSSRDALRAAQRKQARMARDGGPSYVTLTADEMASLIEDGLDPVAQRALDSVEVVLEEDRFALRALLRTDLFGRALLGPLEGVLRDHERLEVAGPARFEQTSVVAWSPDHFRVRSFPFPRAVIPRLVDRLTGRSDGVVPIVVPGTVGDVRIRPDGVTFYRRSHY